MKAVKIPEAVALPFELSLRIRHPSIDPAQLSRELAVESKHSFRAGDPRASRGATASLHNESYWLGILDPTSWPLDIWFCGDPKFAVDANKLRNTLTRKLEWALAFTARRFARGNAALFERIRTEGGQASLLVVLSAAGVGSFNLTPDVSRVFSDLGITVEFELTGD